MLYGSVSRKEVFRDGLRLDLTHGVLELVEGPKYREWMLSMALPYRAKPWDFSSV